MNLSFVSHSPIWKWMNISLNESFHKIPKTLARIHAWKQVNFIIPQVFGAYACCNLFYFIFGIVSYCSESFANSWQTTFVSTTISYINWKSHLEKFSQIGQFIEQMNRSELISMIVWHCILIQKLLNSIYIWNQFINSKLCIKSIYISLKFKWDR